MKKTLLFIGRFQPFHLGHLLLIKKYLKRGYFIKIGIGSSEKAHQIHNPFSIQLIYVFLNSFSYTSPLF